MPTSAPVPLEPYRVLLLDDDPAFLGMMQEYLNHEPGHFQLHTASTGAEALRDLEHFDPDVVVLDICLPDTDGIELLPKIQDRLPQTHFIVSTGHGTEDRRQAALQRGAVRYLEKPFDLAAFRNLVTELAASRPRLAGAGIHLLDLTQMMNMCRKTARLRFQVDSQRATLHFLAGELIHIEDGQGEGEEAFLRASHWGEGSFQALGDDVLPTTQRTIQAPTYQLLLLAIEAQSEAESSAPDAAPINPDPMEPTMPNFKDLLKPFLEIDGVKVAVLVDWDGFVIDGISKEGRLGTDAVGAVISTVLGSTQVIGRELGVGNAEFSMLEYERGSVLFKVLGQVGILAVLLENQASLGLLRFQIRKHAPVIEAALT